MTTTPCRADTTPWYVYLLRCRDGTFYTGVTTDPARRLREHNHGGRGARYTRVRRPVVLAYVETSASRQEACRREYRLRRLSHIEKQRLCITTEPSLEGQL
jgi:putative endonuclease